MTVARTTVSLDYLEAVQLVAAAELREDLLRNHIERIGDVDGGLGRALVHTITAELGIRQAFDITRIDEDVAHDVPECELRALAGDR